MPRIELLLRALPRLKLLRRARRIDERFGLAALRALLQIRGPEGGSFALGFSAAMLQQLDLLARRFHLHGRRHAIHSIATAQQGAPAALAQFARFQRRLGVMQTRELRFKCALALFFFKTAHPQQASHCFGNGHG